MNNVIHHENGDSEFTINVKVYVGAEDSKGSSVTIGSGKLGEFINIEKC